MRRLGDVLASLISKKDNIPYENSVLTKIFADSLGIDALIFPFPVRITFSCNLHCDSVVNTLKVVLTI